MENLTIETTELTISAFINNTRVGYLCLASVEVSEEEYMGGFIYTLIESVEVEKEYRRKGVYTAMINKAIENLKENEYLVSMGRSDDAANFWMNRLELDEEDVELGIEKDQQDNVLMIDCDEDIQTKEISDFSNIDFF